MRSRAGGHRITGGGTVLVGVAAIATGAIRPPFLEAPLLATPSWTLVVTGGSVLALTGVLILLFSFRAPEGPEPEVPAHVAFAQRMTIDDAVPIAAPAPRPAAAAATMARLPAPPTPTQGRVAPTKPDTSQIDAQIRELTKKINKAGVMLATGQLSQQGYLAYVEDLKRQRGKLEAARVRAELRT